MDELTGLDHNLNSEYRKGITIPRKTTRTEEVSLSYLNALSA